MKKTISILTWIFLASGFSSLIYQVVWQRILTMHYGVGAISMTLIVSIYMFGLGIGALIGGHLAERVKNRIIFYFIVELLIGCFGVVSLPFLNMLGRYTAGSNYSFAAIYMLLFLAFPTLLMGITLPLLTKIFNAYLKNFLYSVSFLYFINTLGAAFGAIFASYVIISFFGLDAGIACAAAINFVLAGLIFLIRDSKAEASPPETISNIPGDSSELIRKSAYYLVFVTGFLAIGYEIIWFRVVGIFVKGSPYVFSSVLFVYLLGIAIGSYLMNRIIQKIKIDRENLFYILQFSIGCTALITFLSYYYLTEFTPFEAFTRTSFRNLVHPSFPPFDSLKEFLISLYYLFDVFFWTTLFVFIPTVLMGASFPLISAIALKRPDREGATIGRVYFFNITGNVFGGLITGFVLLPKLSSETTVFVYAVIGIVFGLFVSNYHQRKFSLRSRVIVVALILFGGGALFPRAGELYKTIHTAPDGYETYMEEDIDGVVVTYKKGENLINYINGTAHGWRPLYLYHYETFKAASYASKVERVLIIGYGNGTITEIALRQPHLKQVTVIELNHALINNLEKIPFFEEMLDNDKLDLVIDDGRRYLFRTDQKFDLILIDPLRSKTGYSNNLYSTQFFELISDHLTEDGIFMVWMDEHKVIPKTLSSVFERVQQYSFFTLASKSPFVPNQATTDAFIEALTEEELIGMEEYADSYLGDEEYVRKHTAGYQINQDWKPVCEYYIGLKVKEWFMDKPESR